MRTSTPSVADVRRHGQPPGLLERGNDEHWAGRLYMRRLSPYAAWLAVRLGLHAHAVTAAMLVVGLLGAAALAIDGVLGAVLCVLGIQAYLLLDCADGEVARVNGTSGAVGVFLDRLAHYLVEGALLVALGVRAAGADGQLGWVVVGCAAAGAALTGKLASDLVDVARLRSGLGPADRSAAPPRHEAAARLRTRVQQLKVHRAVGGIEASLLALVAAVLDAVLTAAAEPRVTRWLLLALLTIGMVVAVAHVGVILASDRLR